MLCAKYKKAKAERFYDNKLLAVVENESVLLLYDFPMLCDSETEERRPGIQRKKRKWGWEKKKHCNFNHETSHVREAANSLKLFLMDSPRCYPTSRIGKLRPFIDLYEGWCKTKDVLKWAIS